MSGWRRVFSRRFWEGYAYMRWSAQYITWSRRWLFPRVQDAGPENPLWASVYHGKVMPVEIPKTAVAASAAAEFGTVYDVTKYDGNARTYKRAAEAYDKVTELVEQLIRATWLRQISA